MALRVSPEVEKWTKGTPGDQQEEGRPVAEDSRESLACGDRWPPILSAHWEAREEPGRCPSLPCLEIWENDILCWYFALFSF